MLFLVEQGFDGRDEIRAPLKRPAWEAVKCTDELYVFIRFGQGASLFV